MVQGGATLASLLCCTTHHHHHQVLLCMLDKSTGLLPSRGSCTSTRVHTPPSEAPMMCFFPRPSALSPHAIIKRLCTNRLTDQTTVRKRRRWMKSSYSLGAWQPSTGTGTGTGHCGRVAGPEDQPDTRQGGASQMKWQCSSCHEVQELLSSYDQHQQQPWQW
jgi:hypothetical protein